MTFAYICHDECMMIKLAMVEIMMTKEVAMGEEHIEGGGNGGNSTSSDSDSASNV